MSKRRVFLLAIAAGLFVSILSVGAQVFQIPSPTIGTSPSATCNGSLDLSRGCMIPGLGP